MSLLSWLAEAVVGNSSTVIVFLVVFLLLWYYLRPGSPYKLPPGPPPKFLFGNLGIFAPDKSDRDFDKGYFASRRVWALSKTYNSDLVRIYFGKELYIFLHNFEDIQKLFNLEEFSHRSKSTAREIVFHGLVGAKGPRWKEQRRFALSTLRDFGLGRNKLENIIHEEIDRTVEMLENYNGNAFEMNASTLNHAVANVISSMVFGHRFEQDDPMFQRMLDLIDENFSVNYKMASLGAMIPGYWLVPGDKFKFKRLQNNMKEIYENIAVREYREHLAKYDPNNVEDFIDAYIREIKAREDKPGDEETWFRESQLQASIADLFQAGTDTTSTALRFIVIYMLRYPDVQAKIQAEIHEVIGRDRPVSMRDKLSLPYTEAAICETQRMSPLTPISLGNCSSDEPFHFKGYILPPRTTITANIYSIHMDPEYWGDPEVFRPDRFIDDQGKFRKDERLLTFSTGKRQCLGEGLARMELFLFTVTLLQKFNIQLPDGALMPSLKPLEGSSTSGPGDYQVAFIRD